MPGEIHIEKKVRISVRSLVEFLLREGDIISAGSGFGDREAMQAGSRIHRKLQKARGSSYRAEVSLSYERPFEDVTLVIEGRADGIYEEEGRIWIEEIKGIYHSLRTMDEAVRVHLAQARVYAAIYAHEQGREDMGIRMTYVNLETEEVRLFDEIMTGDMLEKFLNDLAEEYHRWVSLQAAWRQKREASMQGLNFPFPYREGQKDLAAYVYRTIYHKRQLFVQAPTGIGKTMATIFPAVRAVGEEKGDKIFYLTAKTTTRSVAEAAFDLLAQKGLRWKAITLTAKEKLCVCEEVRCDPDFCPRARGHYDRINQALYDMVEGQEKYDREAILAQAGTRQVCPFEFQLDLAEFADAVIGDYNYVFDPRARLKRFFGEGAPRGEWIFLIDESHNLVDRGREMFSADLKRSELVRAGRQIRGRNPSLEKALNQCVRQMGEYGKELEDAEEVRVRKEVGGLILRLMNLVPRLEDHLREETDEEARGEMVSLYFRIMDFLNIHDQADHNYLVYQGRDGEGDLYVRLFCVNPADSLQKILDRGRAAIFFSATLHPMSYYQGLLSGRQDDYAVSFASPFTRENRLIAVGRDVSSLYQMRTPALYDRLASYIDRMVRSRRGNYLVFFPSYDMLEKTWESYELFASLSGVEALVQEPGWGEQRRTEFLDRFSKRPEKGLVGFCIMGGIFSEGIDLTGESLIGALIIGTGIPQISRERELLRSWYDERGMDGFAFAYRYPGLNKVLQAAGRVIRTSADRGIILLLDRRFSYPDYRAVLPGEWSDRMTGDMDSIGEAVEQFWNLHPCLDKDSMNS